MTSFESVRKAINDATASHGDAAEVRHLRDAPKAVGEVIPTGSLLLDWVCLRVGGLPVGRIMEIYGPESCGKTTLAISILAAAQRLFPKKVGLLADAEHALDPEYARNIGWDPEADNSFYSQPEYGEAGLEVVRAAANTGDVSVVVVDSVAALVPKKELEGEIGDSSPGAQARLMSQMLRMTVSAARRTGTSIVFINQLREKIGVMFGSPETTAGGRALKFYADVRLDLRRIETLKSGSGAPHGIRVRARAVKNKLAPPMREAEFDIRFGRGIDRFADLVDASLASGILEKSGSFILLDSKRIGQGRERAASNLASDLDLAKTVEAKTVESFQKAVTTTTESRKPAE